MNELNEPRPSCPRLAITAGDPAGIGPEVIAALWGQRRFHQRCRPVVLGPPAVMTRACRLVGSGTRVMQVSDPSECVAGPECLPVMACGPPDAEQVAPGRLDPRGGQTAYEALVLACDLAQTGQVDAITTAPLNKAALAAAGHDFPGHTELLAHLCGRDEVAMMLYLPPSDRYGGPAGLGVVHVTLHMPLASVMASLSCGGIANKVRLADTVLRCLMPEGGVPRIGVSALNPHAGEDGLFGDEEARIIRPAVEAVIRDGFCVQGPLPADTLLARAAGGEFDAVVAMYHDQGHIALKLLDMHRAVNITLGLPVLRTSVAHGTAFDRAWEGTADPGSLWEAVRVAVRLARGRADLTLDRALQV